jgi:DNA repair protein RadA/Sms
MNHLPEQRPERTAGGGTPERGPIERFKCRLCGHVNKESHPYCFSCNSRNVYESFVIEPQFARRGSVRSPVQQNGSVASEPERPQEESDEVVPITEVPAENIRRVPSGIGPLDRMLGGGVPMGASILIGGDPGIGKSTLLTKLCGKFAYEHSEKTLYCSAEEAVVRVASRAHRIEAMCDDFLIIKTDSVEKVVTAIKRHRPSIVVLDSLQAFRSDDCEGPLGGVSQVVGVTKVLYELVQTALSEGYEVTIFIVCHVTKDSRYAGPRTVEHWIDTNLMLARIGSEQEIKEAQRLGKPTDIEMSSTKNRFGATIQSEIFVMTTHGLEAKD